MKKKSLYFTFQLVLLAFTCSTFAYNDTITHPSITEESINKSQIGQVLKNRLGFPRGLNTKFPAGSQNSVLFWIKRGSIEEDLEPCRRANHMHDPTKTWDISYMSDVPPSELYCYSQEWESKPYSNVTWATGFLGPVPGGQKQTFTREALS